MVARGEEKARLATIGLVRDRGQTLFYGSGRVVKAAGSDLDGQQRYLLK